MAATLRGVLSAYAVQTIRAPKAKGARLFLEILSASGTVLLLAQWLLREPVGAAAYYAPALAVLILAGVVLSLWRAQAAADLVAHWFAALAVTVILSAAAAVYAPHRQYPHYL